MTGDTYFLFEAESQPHRAVPLAPLRLAADHFDVLLILREDIVNIWLAEAGAAGCGVLRSASAIPPCDWDESYLGA